MLGTALAGIFCALGLGACADETISGFADPAAEYALTELLGNPFTANATVAFPSQGQVRGQGPCNNWGATQTAPYPWFALGPIRASQRACDALADERAFFDALSQMTLAEVVGDVLILSDPDLGEMLFQRRD